MKIKAENISSMAAQYGISHKTMQKWLKLANLYKTKEEGYLYTPKEVAAIYEHFGNP